jgi:hypothetical protein
MKASLPMGSDAINHPTHVPPSIQPRNDSKQNHLRCSRVAVKKRGTLLIRNSCRLGPCSRTMSRASWGGGRFRMSEVPLQSPEPLFRVGVQPTSPAQGVQPTQVGMLRLRYQSDHVHSPSIFTIEGFDPTDRAENFFEGSYSTPRRDLSFGSS